MVFATVMEKPDNMHTNMGVLYIFQVVWTKVSIVDIMTMLRVNDNNLMGG